MRGERGESPRENEFLLRRNPTVFGLLIAAPVLFGACSFDYGALSDEAPSSTPDVVMSEVEYVRVRDGKAVVRVQADSLERYEKDRRMVAESPRFKQYAKDGTDGAVGAAAKAVVDLSSGDVSLYGGVSLSIPEEKTVIETDELAWKDGDRTLRGASDKPVLVKKEDGSYLSGVGFVADARRKEWELTGAVSGALVEKDKEKAGDSEPEAGADGGGPGTDPETGEAVQDSEVVDGNQSELAGDSPEDVAETEETADAVQ